MHFYSYPKLGFFEKRLYVSLILVAISYHKLGYPAGLRPPGSVEVFCVCWVYSKDVPQSFHEQHVVDGAAVSWPSILNMNTSF